MNLAHYLADAAHAHPDRPALIVPQPSGQPVVTTFGTLSALSERIAAGLARHVAPGDRVLLAAPLSAELVAALAAVLRNGATVVLPDAAAGREPLAHSLAVARPTVLVGSARARRWRWLMPPLRAVRRVHDLHALAVGGAAYIVPPIADVDPTTPALITFTGGSTEPGGARGVIRSHGVLWAQHAALAAALSVADGDVDLPGFPVAILHNLAAGVTTVVPDVPGGRPGAVDPSRILAQIDAHGVTTASGSPAFWARIADHCLATRSSLPLRRLVLGGAPVSPRLLADLKQAAPDAEIIVLYGSTEVEPVARITATEALAASGHGTAQGAGIPLGHPVPEATVRLVDGAGADVDAGAVGEIIVTGAHVAPGYVDNPSATAARRLTDSDCTTWQRMGDLGYRDAAGRLWLVGRTHSVIHHHSGPLYPVPIEAVAETLPFVRQAALVGLRGPGGPEERAVLAVVTDDTDPLPPNWQVQLRDRCLAALGVWPVDELRRVASLPTDPRHNARIDYPALVRRLVDADSPANFRAYLKERFPPVLYGILIVSYFSANYALAQAVTRPHLPIFVTWQYLAGCLVLLGMFFHLRVVDEHKDYTRDMMVHPGRVLSRGLVTLPRLRRLGWAAIGVELVLSAAMGRPTLVATLAVLALSYLILRDFFASGWLDRHMLTNALVHMLIMPLYALFVYSAATDRFLWTAPPLVLLYAWVSFCVGLALEIARKIRAPEDERPGLLTYSAAMGPRPAAFAVLIALLAGGALSSLVGHQLGFGVVYHVSVLTLLGIVTISVVQFSRLLTRPTAERVMARTSLFIFAFDWLLAGALVLANGVRWG